MGNTGNRGGPGTSRRGAEAEAALSLGATWGPAVGLAGCFVSPLWDFRQWPNGAAQWVAALSELKKSHNLEWSLVQKGTPVASSSARAEGLCTLLQQEGDEHAAAATCNEIMGSPTIRSVTPTVVRVGMKEGSKLVVGLGNDSNDSLCFGGYRWNYVEESCSYERELLFMIAVPPKKVTAMMFAQWPSARKTEANNHPGAPTNPREVGYCTITNMPELVFRSGQQVPTTHFLCGLKQRQSMVHRLPSDVALRIAKLTMKEHNPTMIELEQELEFTNKLGSFCDVTLPPVHLHSLLVEVYHSTGELWIGTMGEGWRSPDGYFADTDNVLASFRFHIERLV
ncbi:hypothetical protein Pelo_16171 [Pelomyxa schiedti]|nr:hypothetical protein Pelo_16171 [Pelomyxa schiedti]